MDTSKYKDNFELVEASEENGLLTQSYYDPINHVKYNRIVWTGNFDAKDKEMIEIIKEMCMSSVKLISSTLPNVAKIEVSDYHMESMYFEDDDVKFNSLAKLQPILDKLGLRNRLTVRNLLNNKDDYFKAMEELTTNQEYLDAIKDVYKDYLDKEL